MWTSRAFVLACVAAFCGESKAGVALPQVQNLGDCTSDPSTLDHDAFPLDLFPLLDLRLRRDVTADTDADAPEPMTGDARAIAYPMVPAPGAGQSGVAFGSLLLLGIGYRFWRYGRLTLR